MPSRVQSLPIVKQTALLTEVALFLMNREQRPAALIDTHAHFAAVNSAFERLVGHPAAKLLGKHWAAVLAQTADAKAVRTRLREALAKRALQVELPVTTSVDRRVVLTAELHGVGKRGALLIVASWSAADRDRTPLEVSDLVYEIELADFGALRWARSDDLPDSSRIVAQRCHSVLYGRDTPCSGCPALEIRDGSSEATSILRGKDADPPLLVDARRVDADNVRLNVRRISPDIFTMLVEARIATIARKGKLTERETEVARLMLLGRSAREVSRALHISYSTAKFHQTNVVRKLSVESRFGLLRLLL